MANQEPVRLSGSSGFQSADLFILTMNAWIPPGKSSR
jgi:hypothetical protein